MSSNNKQTVNELKDLQDIERELQPHERIVYDVFEPKQPPDKPSFNDSVSGAVDIECVYECGPVMEYLRNLPFRRSNVVKLEPLKEVPETYVKNTGVPFAPSHYPIGHYRASLPERSFQHYPYRVVGVPFPQYRYPYPHYLPAAHVHRPQRRV